MGKIILEKPYNLFNYSNIGYQTYFQFTRRNRPAWTNYILTCLSFGRSYRHDITLVEPVHERCQYCQLIDMTSIKASEVSLKQRLFVPNGFDGKEICAISRYAGISNKVSSFGIYEYNAI